MTSSLVLPAQGVAMQSVVPDSKGPALQLNDAGLFQNGRWLFRNLNLTVESGEVLAVTGPSGAGKSSLLDRFACDVPMTEGNVRVGLGKPAFVYQDLRLVPQATLLENVLCSRLSRHSAWRTLFGFPKADRDAAMQRLADVDLERLAHRRVMEVSGGEKQRTAIARALFQCSPLLLADEPMANLDEALAERMLSLLRREGCINRLAVICVLHHEEQVQSCADRALRLLGDGKWRIDVIDR